MKWIKAITAWFGMVIAGMYGGQKNKAVRRFGLPAIATGYGLSVRWDWRYFAFLGFIPVLVAGYGVDSALGNWLGHIEWLIRLVYALLLSLPFFVFGLWRGVWASVLLVVAFQVHAGSLGHIAWFGDLLGDDIVRYGVLGALVIFNIMIRKK
jgi:hypothetical protein